MKMQNGCSVVKGDLDFICEALSQELDSASGKHFLVTGGGGFLGYYFVQALLNWNQKNSGKPKIQITVLDNFIRGTPAWLLDLRQHQELKLLVQDISKPFQAPSDPIHYVIHAASIASPIYYRLHPIETMDANVLGLRHLLDYALQQKQTNHPVEAFLFFSSSEIYGDPDPKHIPTSENYWGNVSCTGPRACYDESKRFGETLCVNFARHHGLPVKTARPFNNYGPGLKISDRRIIPDLARDVFLGKDLILLSDGSPTRTFCYIADAIVGYFKVSFHGKAGEAYNIGTEMPEVSMAELAKRVAAIASELTGYSGKVSHQKSMDRNYLTDNPNRRCPDISKARRELQYDPQIALDEGLRRALVWYQNNQQAEDA